LLGTYLMSMSVWLFQMDKRSAGLHIWDVLVFAQERKVEQNGQG
jgi:hypothetical protein